MEWTIIDWEGGKSVLDDVFRRSVPWSDRVWNRAKLFLLQGNWYLKLGYQNRPAVAEGDWAPRRDDPADWGWKTNPKTYLVEGGLSEVEMTALNLNLKEEKKIERRTNLLHAINALIQEWKGHMSRDDQDTVKGVYPEKCIDDKFFKENLLMNAKWDGREESAKRFLSELDGIKKGL